MKKSAGFIAILFLFCGGAFVTSCITKDDEGVNAPTVDPASDGTSYVIGFNSEEGMYYANIFRESGEPNANNTDFLMNDNYKCVNIGQVSANNVDKLMINGIVFNDPYTRYGAKYRYFIRYYNNKFYTYTDNSPIVDGLNKDIDAYLSVADKDSDGKNTDGIAALTFKSEDDEEDPLYTLTLGTAITLPENFNILSVILTVADDTTLSKPFKIKKLVADDDGNIDYTVDENTYIDLQKKLLASFFDKDLTVDGLIGIKEDETKNENYKRYYWTEPITGDDLTLNDENGEAIKEKKIKVPSVLDQTNGFDYSSAPLPKDRAAFPQRILVTEDDEVFDITPAFRQ